MSSADPIDASTYAGILEGVADGVGILAADGTIEFLNSLCKKLHRVAADGDPLGSEFAQLWPAAERERARQAVRDAAAGTQVRFESHFPDAGEAPWWEVRMARLPIRAGLPARISAVYRDLSEQRLADLAVRANEDRFALLLESSGDGIYGMAVDGSCTFINTAGASMLGYRPETLVGKSLHSIIHHHHADATPYTLADCKIYQSANSGSTARIDDEVFWHRDGRPIPVTYSVFPMIVDGRQIGTVVTFSDTTDRRRVENDLRILAAELSEADRRKTEFLATLAHELRNPLAPLSHGLELLAKSGDSPDAIAKVRDMMQRQLGQMVHLVNDLLDIARISSGKMELRTELVDLHRIVTVALEASASSIEGCGHKLLVTLPKEPVYLQADITRLTQVLSNILNNAAKYTPPGGMITVSAAVVGEEAWIRIVDTGMGISKESLSAVFEMFTQVGREVHAVPGGLGIGLNLVRRLVELHGGSVAAESAGVGRGSTFSVRLPLASVQVLPATVPADGESTAAQAALRILIVDDNVDAAESMSMLFTLGEHIARVAHNGADALQTIAEFEPHVVFLDIGMPVMNGYEVAREARKLAQARNTLLVALTGWGGADDRRRSKEAGFDDHLTKPVDFATVDRLLKRMKLAVGVG